eukprot:s3258_g9.t1
MEEKRHRYLDSEMCECSDDEYWALVHYGPPSDSADENSEGSPMSNGAMVRCSAISPELRQTRLESNELLRARIQRLECEWDGAQVANDLDAMDSLEDQIRDAHGLMYTGLDET